jgi:hypothetical protein
LGIIPGTDVQISFTVWLTAILAVLLGYLTWKNRVYLRMQLAITRIRLAIVTHQLEIK